jgi:hypothetical protein
LVLTNCWGPIEAEWTSFVNWRLTTHREFDSHPQLQNSGGGIGRRPGLRNQCSKGRESSSLSPSTILKNCLRLAARTADFQSENAGSSPVGNTKFILGGSNQGDSTALLMQMEVGSIPTRPAITPPNL